MAAFVFKNASLTVGGTDLSDHVQSIEVTFSADAPEATVMGDTWIARLAGGLKDTSVTVNFLQDFASSKTNPVLWTAFGTSAAIVVKSDSGAVSTTNPSYSFSAIVNDIKPLSGSVGDVAVQSVTWPGTGTVTQATS